MDIGAGLAVLDGEGDALLLIGEVRRLDRLRRNREGSLGWSFGLAIVSVVAVILAVVIAVFVAVVPVVFADNVDGAVEVSDSVPSRSMVTVNGTSPTSRFAGSPSYQRWSS